jgi:small subunit ribosomal protein S4
MFLYRIGLAPTIYAARQFVSHGHVLVNGKRLNIPSYKVTLNDEISLNSKGKNNLVLKEFAEKNTKELPEYITTTKESDNYNSETSNRINMSYKFKNFPEEISKVPYECKMEINLVIEFYSR